MRIIIICSLIMIVNSFLNKNFGIRKPFNFKNEEISNKIEYKTTPNKQNIINKISGFYGLIGPDNNNNITDLFKLFNRNGIIQGIFFDKGNIHFIKNYIRTDKLLYEEMNGEIVMNNWNMLIFKIFEKMKLLPNILGLANTALLKFNNKLYALNERDLPYEIMVNYKNKSIDTIRKVNLNYLKHFSAHTKIINNNLETIDYSSMMPQFSYFIINNKFKKEKQININTKYMPMIHDFVSLNDNILILDSPMKFDIEQSKKANIPLKFHPELLSEFYIINKNNGNINKIMIKDSFFIFHYANSYENDDYIIVYACVYDTFDFNNPYDNYGRYRKLLINKKTNELKVLKNNELEKYSLDFPIQYKDLTILSITDKLKINGFIVVNDFKIVKKININKNILGEHSIIEIDNKPYIICFTNDKKNISYITLYNINDNNEISIKLPFNVTMGFHSIFYSF